MLQGDASGGEWDLTIPSRIRTSLNSRRIVYAVERSAKSDA
jgi:hypothetical protein